MPSGKPVRYLHIASVPLRASFEGIVHLLLKQQEQARGLPVGGSTGFVKFPISLRCPRLSVFDIGL